MKKITLLIILNLIFINSGITRQNKYQHNKNKNNQIKTLKNIEVKNCVQIYYDDSESPLYNWIGEMFSIHLFNLISHFPKYQTIIKPVRDYQKDEIIKL